MMDMQEAPVAPQTLEARSEPDVADGAGQFAVAGRGQCAAVGRGAAPDQAAQVVPLGGKQAASIAPGRPWRSYSII